MADERVVVGRGHSPIAGILDEAIEANGGRDRLAEQITPERIEALCDRHVRMYATRLASGNPAVNVRETSRLLELWKGIRGKNFSELGDAERLEVLDAVVSG